jgi:hypothetical protein
LLAFGADVNLTNCEGESALKWACCSLRSKDFLPYFENAKPLLNDGSLHDVAKLYRLDVLKVLLRNGHDPNHRSELHGRRTVLEEICLNYHYNPRERHVEDSLRLLISHGAKIQTEPLVPGVKQSMFLAIDNGDKDGYQLVEHLLNVLFRPRQRMFRVGSEVGPVRLPPYPDLAPDKWLYLEDGVCRSPLVYLEEKPAPWKDPSLNRMKSYGLERIRYRLTGPQPVDAVGVPPEILEEERKAREVLRAEEERKLGEQLLEKECGVCGEPTTDPKAVHGALTPSCTHKWSVVICMEDLQTYLATRIAPEHGRVSSSIPCWAPNCNAILRHHEIQQYANAQDFEAYDDALGFEDQWM